MEVHQYAIFGDNARLTYEYAVRHIAIYLESMSTYIYLSDVTHHLYTHGIVYKPDK